MKKSLFLKIFAVILVACSLFVFVACNETGDDDQIVQHADHSNAVTPKVVLFIGDGMGPNHIYNTELYMGKSTYFSSFQTKTFMETNSLDGVTDSAASATAMATGQKTENGFIGVDANEKNLVSITELAKTNLYGTGVVTSDEITGATPAGFSAHAGTRNNSAEILLSQSTTNLDLLLGSGSYSSAYNKIFAEKGWNWVENKSQLSLERKRFIATFDDVVYENGTDTAPTLEQLATYAIDYMETNYPTGYFLVIEGAKIDKESHSNDVNEMMKNLIDFDNAVKVVDQKLSSGSLGYSIIVTADHETGGLERANSKDEITDELYTSTDHTATNVELFFKSTLTTPPALLNSELIPNTDVFNLCKYLLSIN